MNVQPLNWQFRANQLEMSCPAHYSGELFLRMMRAVQVLDLPLESLYSELVKDEPTSRFVLKPDPQGLRQLRQVPKLLRDVWVDKPLSVPLRRYEDVRIFVPAYDNNNLCELAELLVKWDVFLRRLRVDIEDMGSRNSLVTLVTGRLGVSAGFDVEQVKGEMLDVLPEDSKVTFLAPHFASGGR
jgi:hypothetical protein